MIAVGPPEYVGKFPIRQDITVLPADKPRMIPKGNVVLNPEDQYRLDIVPDGCLKVWDCEVLSFGKRKPVVKEPEEMEPQRLGFVIHEQIGIGIVNSAALNPDNLQIDMTPDGCLKVWDDEILSRGGF